MKKILILVTCILMSFNMNAYANEDKDTVSIKGVVEGTKKAVGKVGDKISETTKNIYEAEIPKDKLIDAAGCRGLRVGEAQVSELHCNFLINHGNASAADIETLGETVRQRVLETSDIDLDWEIRRIGEVAHGG